MDSEPNDTEPSVTDCEARYRQLLDVVPVAIYSTDASGRVTQCNREAAALWGRELVVGADLRSASLKIFWPDGRPMEWDECPMAETLRSGQPVRGHEIVVERPDGSRRRVMPHPNAIRNQTGEITAAVNMLEDVTERRQWEASGATLSAIVESSDDAIISKDLTGVIRSWNGGAQRMFGYSADEVVGRHISILIPPERQNEEPAILARLVKGDRVDPFETERMTKDGRHIHISLCVSPVRDRNGTVIGASKVARDITDRKRVEAELNSYRDLLEQKVQSRTSALEQSMHRLRLAERMASLGTLSVGLGHDVANLLVPLRVRLESLSRADLSKDLREDVEAIGSSAVYLQRLANGLRLLAVDPERAPRGEATSLLTWWDDVQPMLKNVLPRRVELKAIIPQGDCVVAMSRAALMQVVFNLVQNSGEAMKERGTGCVVVSAEPVGKDVRITVSDDGPGMTPEVQHRCMEPFFSTKVRGISTGLGLVLVYGLVRDAQGCVTFESKPGVGTTFTLTLPMSKLRSMPAPGPPRVVVVKTRDARIGAFIAAEFRAQSFTVRNSVSAAAVPDVFVTDESEPVPAECAAASIIILGKSSANRPGVSVIELPLKPQAVRDVVSRLSREVPRAVT